MRCTEQAPTVRRHVECRRLRAEPLPVLVLYLLGRSEVPRNLLFELYALSTEFPSEFSRLTASLRLCVEHPRGMPRGHEPRVPRVACLTVFTPQPTVTEHSETTLSGPLSGALHAPLYYSFD